MTDQTSENNIKATQSILPHQRVFISLAGIFGVFIIVAIALSSITGAPFTAPTERVSHAIGFNYIIPFSIGIIGYLIAQAYAAFKTKDAFDLNHNIRIVLTDTFFLVMFASVIYIHFQIKAWMPLINPHLYDQLYFDIDNKLSWIISGMAWLRNSIGSLTPRFDYLYQIGFLAMFAFGLWAHAISDRRWHYHNMFAILLMQMIGAFTYLIAPAVGPFIFENGPNEAATIAQSKMYAAFQELQTQGAEWLAVNGGEYFTGPPAAMPSLHIAGATIILWYMLKIRSVFLPFVAFMFFWVFIESVVSRWHYFIDLPPGILLACLCIYITNKVCAPADKNTE